MRVLTFFRASGHKLVKSQDHGNILSSSTPHGRALEEVSVSLRLPCAEWAQMRVAGSLDGQKVIEDVELASLSSLGRTARVWANGHLTNPLLEMRERSVLKQSPSARFASEMDFGARYLTLRPLMGVDAIV